MLWLQVMEYISSSLSSLCVTMLVAQVGLSCVAQISCATAMLAFPVDMSPSIAGLSKAYYAFGGSVFACVASAYFYNAEKAYILFIALTVSIIVPSLGQLLNFLPDEVMSNMEYEEQHDIDPTLSHNFHHAMALFTCILLYVILRLSEVSHAILGFSAAIVVLCAVSILLIPVMKNNVYMYIPNKNLNEDEVKNETVNSPLGHEQLADITATGNCNNNNLSNDVTHKQLTQKALQCSRGDLESSFGREMETELVSLNKAEATSAAAEWQPEPPSKDLSVRVFTPILLDMTDMMCLYYD